MVSRDSVIFMGTFRSHFEWKLTIQVQKKIIKQTLCQLTHPTSIGCLPVSSPLPPPPPPPPIALAEILTIFWPESVIRIFIDEVPSDHDIYSFAW